MISSFNDKVKASIFDTEYLTVWEGSVRSAKTTASLLAWLFYISLTDEKVFLMSGNTAGSLCRNCIDGDYGLIALTNGMAKKVNSKDVGNHLVYGDKIIYYCGADNKKSYEKMRGITLGGWYADEINLHHREFLEEQFRRTIASTDRRHFWTLNPSQPSHWIYKEYIDRYRDEELKGYRYHHFNLDDNPALSEERKTELKKQYTGVFYQRYILGRRVSAEGACYPSFKHNKAGEIGNILDKVPDILFCAIGVDIGGSGSATCFNCTGFFKQKEHDRMSIVTLAEHYDTQNIRTETVLDNFRMFVNNCKERFIKVSECYVDSAEQLILKSLRNLGIIVVHNSKKCEIVDRVRASDLLYAQQRKFIMRDCKNMIEAVESAVWDSKAKKETRLDDGSSNIDSLDADEYSWESKMSLLVR